MSPRGYRPRTTIDLREEIAAAWDRCWKRNLESRMKGLDFGGRTYYLSATDLEREIREEFVRRTGSYRNRISGLGRRSLLDHVREYLFARARLGELEVDTRGRGHCSGARFRPAGEPSSPAEKRIDALPKAERDRRRHVRHLTVSTAPKYGDPERLCYVAPKKKRRVSSASRRRRTYPTRDPAAVTCKKCAKILERDFVRAVVFGEEKPVLARVLERAVDGSPSSAVDATGRVLEGVEFLPALVGRSAEVAR